MLQLFSMAGLGRKSHHISRQWRRVHFYRGEIFFSKREKIAPHFWHFIKKSLLDEFSGFVPQPPGQNWQKYLPFHHPTPRDCFPFTLEMIMMPPPISFLFFCGAQKWINNKIHQREGRRDFFSPRVILFWKRLSLFFPSPPMRRELIYSVGWLMVGWKEELVIPKESLFRWTQQPWNLIDIFIIFKPTGPPVTSSKSR